MNSINISKNITDLRKTAGVTQEQLATALNVSSQAVSKWETNTCQPATMTLPLIADYFHVSVDYLFYGKIDSRSNQHKAKGLLVLENNDLV